MKYKIINKNEMIEELIKNDDEFKTIHTATGFLNKLSKLEIGMLLLGDYNNERSNDIEWYIDRHGCCEYGKVVYK